MAHIMFMADEPAVIEAAKKKAYDLIMGGEFTQARLLYEQICRDRPQDAEAWFLLGAVNGQLGHFDETIACCRQVIALQPDNTDAHYNLAQACMHQHRYREAVEAYRIIVQRQPRHVPVLNNLGYALQQIGRFEEAVACHRQALQLQPHDAEALNNLGNALLGLGRRAEAEAAYREALHIRPEYAEAYNNLSTVLQRLGRYRDATAACEEALRLRPNYVEAYVTYGTLLLMQGLYEPAEQAFRKALEINPDANKARSGLLFCLNYHSSDPEMVFREHRQWDEQHGRPLATRTKYSNLPDPGRRLRVGYVSPDLRTHSVSYFFEPLLAGHDPNVVETVCYADVDRPDATTARLKSLCGAWRDIAGQSPTTTAEQIMKDEIDILVDLAGHTGQDLLLVFARKPAPVQVTYLGYPNTTGMSAMDYRFTDAWADPPGQTEAWHSETLVRLPHGFLCYEPRAEADIPVAPPPALENGFVTYGSFNNLSKITPDVVTIWARILRSVPNARLLIKNKTLQDAAICNRYYALFAQYAIPPERVELVGWIASPGSHLELYGKVDIALDTFPYNGTTTTCEALWMGVPMITLAGRMHAGRVGVSLLSQLGLGEFIAADEEDYIRLATALAGDRDRCAQLRKELRERLKNSPLCDSSAFAREVENAYRTMWRKWCADVPMSERT